MLLFADSSLIWQPVASPVQIAAGAVVLAALTVWSYFRSLRERPVAASILGAWRLAVVVALAVLMMGPSRVLPRPTQLSRSKLSVLLDTSASMVTEDDEGVCRIDRARKNWLNDEILTALSKDFDVELNAFDDEVRPLPRSQIGAPAGTLAAGRVTRLSNSVMQTLTRIPFGTNNPSLLVISDGRDSEEAPIQPAAALAKSRNIPVYSVLVGRDTHFHDVAVLSVPMQDHLLPGEAGGLLVKVYQSGLDASTVTLHVRQGDQHRTFPVSFLGKPVVEVQIPVKHDEPGQYEYTVSTEAVPGEATESNNASTVFCDVQRKRIKVLLLEGQPHWDTKFLAQSLRKDERIELVQISQLSSAKRETIVTRTESKSPQVPAKADEWTAYDVVILGRGMERVLNGATAKALAEFVSEQGGHLIFARGRPADPAADIGYAVGGTLTKLSPVEWGTVPARDLRLALTPAGRISPWFAPTKMGVNVERALEKLPGFETMESIEDEKPASVILARAGPEGANAGSSTGQAAIAQMQYGRGSVLAVTGQGLWRWSLLSDKSEEFVGMYDAFWSNLIRYMTIGGDFPPGQQVSLKLARTTARLGDQLAVDVACKHAPAAGVSPVLQLVDASGKWQDVLLERQPGREPRFRAQLDPKTVGVYRVVLKTPGMSPAEQEQRFSVYDVNEEKLNTTVNPMPLKVLAEHSGGEFFEVDQSATFLERLRRHRLSLEAPPQTEYIWDDGRFLVLLLTWAGIEWIVRRRVGLI